MPPPVSETILRIRLVLSSKPDVARPISAAALPKLTKLLGATMIRNAGGRASDAIRSLAVLQTLGRFGTIVVMQHNDCGLTHVHDADVRKDLEQISPKYKESFEAMEFGEITTSYVFPFLSALQESDNS